MIFDGEYTPEWETASEEEIVSELLREKRYVNPFCSSATWAARSARRPTVPAKQRRALTDVSMHSWHSDAVLRQAGL